MQTTEQKPKSKAHTGKCRGKKYHSDSHNHHAVVRYCHRCNDTVTIIQNNICYCCGNKIEREENFLIVRRIMNKVILDYQPLIEQYQIMPTPRNIKWIAEVKHGTFVYQVDIKYAVLYLELQEMDADSRRESLSYIKENIDTVSFTRAWGSKQTSKMQLDLLY